MHPTWAIELRDRALADDVAFFFKQWGEWEPMMTGRSWIDGLLEMDRKDWTSMLSGTAILQYDGKVFVPERPYEAWLVREGERLADEEDQMSEWEWSVAMHRVGKKTAGRKLEGRTWSEMPDGSHARHDWQNEIIPQSESARRDAVSSARAAASPSAPTRPGSAAASRAPSRSALASWRSSADGQLLRVLHRGRHRPRPRRHRHGRGTRRVVPHLRLDGGQARQPRARLLLARGRLEGADAGVRAEPLRPARRCCGTCSSRTPRPSRSSTTSVRRLRGRHIGCPRGPTTVGGGAVCTRPVVVLDSKPRRRAVLENLSESAHLVLTLVDTGRTITLAPRAIVAIPEDYAGAVEAHRIEPPPLPDPPANGDRDGRARRVSVVTEDFRAPPPPPPAAEPSLHIPNSLSIGAYMHCRRCLSERPAGESPNSYARLAVGMTKEGLQIWCNRHECNVMHVHFQGIRHPANMTAPQTAEEVADLSARMTDRGSPQGRPRTASL